MPWPCRRARSGKEEEKNTPETAEYGLRAIEVLGRGQQFVVAQRGLVGLWRFARYKNRQGSPGARCQGPEPCRRLPSGPRKTQTGSTRNQPSRACQPSGPPRKPLASNSRFCWPSGADADPGPAAPPCFWPVRQPRRVSNRRHRVGPSRTPRPPLLLVVAFPRARETQTPGHAARTWPVGAFAMPVFPFQRRRSRPARRESIRVTIRQDCGTPALAHTSFTGPSRAACPSSGPDEISL